ncbi:hypothetical protein BDV23DRAFT_149176 [Aspergillus alliaceus]|uniref:3-hydroxyacyl-CoA dehydrogenase n=1 Tax=Petromyces alliaceus TaxID=209559 RepID=A0A5N7CGX3_PETAA|nr:hypothetical protein BDV23DRAFT_149176 [Aspergillus alliaceus]
MMVECFLSKPANKVLAPDSGYNCSSDADSTGGPGIENLALIVSVYAMNADWPWDLCICLNERCCSKETSVLSSNIKVSNLPFPAALGPFLSIRVRWPLYYFYIMIAPSEPIQPSNSAAALTQFIPGVDFQEAFNEKVIMIVGGANGIGASLVQLCCQSGAYVCIGDVDTIRGEALNKKCREKWPVYWDPALPPKPPRTSFFTVDVTNYQTVISLFDRAFQTYKRIDHVVVTAGSMDAGNNWFDQKLSLQSVREPPSTKDIDVNLVGSLYVTRVASVYLRHNRGPGVDRSILLFSCAAGFKETPGVSIYQASKHGVQGLMRSLRPYFPSPYKHNLRINTICPWMTETRTTLTKKVQDRWTKEGLPVSTPQEVALISAGVLSNNSLNGTSMYVEGGRAWEIEANIDRLEPEWLGEEASKTLALGQKVLNDAWGS